MSTGVEFKIDRLRRLVVSSFLIVVIGCSIAGKGWAQEPDSNRWMMQGLVGIPFGLGVRRGMDGWGSFILSGGQIQVGYFTAEDGFWQVDADYFLRSRPLFGTWFFDGSIGPQYWTGFDGTWWALRVLPGIGTALTATRNIELIVAVGSALFFYPRFAPELNAHAMIQFTF